MSKLILLFCTTALLSSATSTFIVCSTGESIASGSACGAAINSPAANNLSADGNWYVASNGSGAFQSLAFVTVNNAFPLQNVGPWLANNASSAWITTTNNQADTFPIGDVFFSTQFSLTAGQVSTAVIAGFWIADGEGVATFLNGVAVSQSSLPPINSVGGPMTPFTISGGDPAMGQAVFITGANTVTFEIFNDTASTVEGVRVLITEADAATPEPATFLTIGAGLALLAMLIRRRNLPLLQ